MPQRHPKEITRTKAQSLSVDPCRTPSRIDLPATLIVRRRLTGALNPSGGKPGDRGLGDSRKPTRGDLPQPSRKSTKKDGRQNHHRPKLSSVDHLRPLSLGSVVCMISHPIGDIARALYNSQKADCRQAVSLAMSAVEALESNGYEISKPSKPNKRGCKVTLSGPNEMGDITCACLCGETLTLSPRRAQAWANIHMKGEEAIPR